MGSFVEELWSSIFTPGPTPTLLVATNATFAALQLVLFALLLTTYSIHFVVLSLLSASLWWSINWFAREVRQVQAAEAEKERSAREIPTDVKDKHDGNRKTPGSLDSTDSDTETESITEYNRSPDPSGSALRSTPVPTTLQPAEASGEIRKRLSVGGDSSGYVSTDSEWEKVDNSNAT